MMDIFMDPDEPHSLFLNSGSIQSLIYHIQPLTISKHYHYYQRTHSHTMAKKYKRKEKKSFDLTKKMCVCDMIDIIIEISFSQSWNLSDKHEQIYRFQLHDDNSKITKKDILYLEIMKFSIGNNNMNQGRNLCGYLVNQFVFLNTNSSAT